MNHLLSHPADTAHRRPTHAMARLSLFILLTFSLLLAGVVTAQELPEATAEPVPTATPLRVTVSTFEPVMMVAGTQRPVTVFGANFTAQSTVRFIGAGLGKTTFVNSTTLLADLPDNVPAGSYPVEVSDPAQGSALAPASLMIVAPTATPRPTTDAPAIPTLPLPTAIPGKPLLVTRNFSSNPASIAPGGAVTLTFEVVNQGNQAAQGVSVALGSGSKFLPAIGQSSATLPDIFPGAVATASLTVNAALDAPNGPNNIPLTLTYRDPGGEIITNTVNLSVNVVAQTSAAQVIIARYRYVPALLRPGDALTLTLLVTNSGSETARGILIRLGKDGVLLPGSSGDSVAVGDLGPGVSQAVDLPLIVKQDAKTGMQPQPLTITYTRSGSSDPIEVTSGITLDISAATVQAPLILLKNYSIMVDGEAIDSLTPGQRFTLDFTIQNLGNAALKNVLIAFGSVETSSPPPTGGDNGGSGSGGSGSGGSTTVQPSLLFAPLGSGGTLFIDGLAAQSELTLTQEFIVNGTTKSGIYALPISLNYRDAQNATAQTSLNASLVVVALPRLQVVLPAPLPEVAYTNEPLPLTVTVRNLSGAIVRLSEFEVTTEQGDVVEGAQGELSNLPVDDEVTINAMIMPTQEGDVTLNFVLRYVDDLNQTRELRETYTVRAEAAPVIDFGPQETPPPETPAAPEPLTFGRVLMALLGLGS